MGDNTDLNTRSSPYESLLRRGMLFIEDGDFSKADEYFERVLDENPEESRAYWGKLLVKLKYTSNDEILLHWESLENYPEYKKALRFSADNERSTYLSIEQKRSENPSSALKYAEEQFKAGSSAYYMRDYMQAFDYLSRAADKGHGGAQALLGVLYSNGLGIPQDYMKASEWFLKAADKGNPSAQFDLGQLYYYKLIGRGSEDDNKTALSWFMKAAEQGLDKAQDTVGLLFHLGLGTDRNDVAAFRWFQQAADQGYAEAQYHLGYCYSEGIGIPEDKDLAKEWYSKASNQGYAKARAELENLAETVFVKGDADGHIVCPKCGSSQMIRPSCWKCGIKFKVN